MGAHCEGSMAKPPQYAAIPFSLGSGSPFNRFLFARRHRTTSGDGDACTLFVANVPPCATCESLRDTFEKFGPVSDVTLGGTVAGGAKHVAHIVFERSGSVDAAVRTHGGAALEMSGPTTRGLDRWLEEYKEENSASPEELLRKADDHMQDYDTAMEAIEHARLANLNKADDDGFITVQPRRGKKSVGITGKDLAALDSTHRGKGRKKKKKKAVLENFYTFQTRENKRERVAKLREQFEADKQRISTMKAERKFKPY